MSSLNSTVSSPSTDSTTSLSTTSSDISSSTSTSTSSTTSSSSSSTSSTSSSTSTSTLVTTSSIAPTTIYSTSVYTVTPTSATEPSTSVLVSTITKSATVVPVTSSSSSSSSTTAVTLNNGGSNDGHHGSGLSTAGITAVAVVVPVAVVALLVLAGIFLWRKRKQKKAAEEMRRKEVEDYGFNPNNDPTLPTVASESGHEMSEDHSSGYRGWGAAAGSNRKMSTTLSGGHTQGQLSDAGSNLYRPAGSPNGGLSDQSGDALMQNRRETMNSDDVGSLGQGPVAGGATLQPGMKRGPSNASSTYSAGDVSDISEGPPPGGMSYDPYQQNNGYGYSQHGPYGDGTYTGQDNGMPVVRDVSARRNTRIQQPGSYQQGNSGISQNF